MTMTYNGCSDETVVVACRLVTGDDPNDRILQQLTSSDTLVTYPLAFRFNGSPSNSTVSYRGREPFVKHDTYVEGWDRFGNLVSTIGHMLTDWDFTGRLTPPSEKPITHFNLKGVLEVDDVDPLLYPYDPSSAPQGVRVLGDGGPLGVWPIHYEQVSGIPGKLQLSLPAPHVSGGVEYTYARLMTSPTRVQYVRRLEWFEGGRGWITLHWIRYEFEHYAGGGLPYGDYYLTDVLGPFIQLKKALVYSTSYLPGYEPPDASDYWYPSLEEDLEYSGWVAGFSPEYVAVLASTNRGGDRLTPLLNGEKDKSFSYDNFCTCTSILLRDCYASAYMSSTNAMDEMISRTSSNHIEFLAELDDLCRGIDVVRAVKALMAIRRKPVEAVKALLQLLAEAKLVWSFGIAPTMSDASDVSRKAGSLYRKFSGSELYAEQTIRGKFNLEIPDEFCQPFVGMRLATRSKVRIRLNEDSLLATLLPWRALGLLPSVSTLWDLVPYSFLVDWFVPVGEIADRLETGGLMWMSEVSYSTHSIKLEWDLSEDLLHSYGVRNASGELSRFLLYDRFVLSHLPTAAPTRLPLYGGFGVPDWTLLSALVYTKIK